MRGRTEKSGLVRSHWLAYLVNDRGCIDIAENGQRICLPGFQSRNIWGGCWLKFIRL
jgi:hypothetical protein